MNKTILVDNTDNYTISGVLKDLPNNTQFDFEFLLPWKNKENSRADMSWTDDQVATFAELRPSVKKELINNKITNVITRYSSNMKHAQVFLYPFSKVWLYGDFNNGKPVGGGIDVVHVFYLIALILLFIGSVNFMNLSTARSERRAKEVGVRKIAGADRSSLITQFIGESIMLAFIAGSIALAIAWLVLPSFNQLTEKHIEIEYQSFSFWIAAICFVLFTGILAGSYPAFYLSSFGVLRILKGSTKNVHAMLAPRKILVVMQFIISIIIINYCYVIQKQTDHAQNRDVGFLKNDLVFHPMTNDLQKNFELVKQELFNTGKVIAVNKTNTLITSGGSETNKLEWKGMAMNFNFELMTSDADFIKTNGLKLLAGRDLDVAVFPADTASCLVNETALKMIGYKNPIGQILKEDGIDCKIIGVIKDFLIGSPFQDTRSLMVRGSTNAGFINIRLNPDNAASNLKDVRNILKKYNPNYITELQFANDDYARKLKGAEITLTLTRGFAFIAIFISCLGLFGLGTFMAENRTNEIGVRKVLGASVASIAYLLTRDFIKLVIIAILIASPIAWLLMNSYLRGFSYRTNIAWWALLATGLFSIFIALMTVSFQAIKAAIANPVKSLRTE
ncbi:MAG: FtsX-like permease family protein [Segetibacter sp.]